MKAIRTALDIDASAATVWAVLVDFDAYAQWNPVEISMRGQLDVGAVLAEHGAGVRMQASIISAEERCTRAPVAPLSPIAGEHRLSRRCHLL